MPLDAGIYQNALSRPRSAQEYTNDYLQTAGAAQNLLAARAQAMERQRALEDQNTIRNAISGLGAAATDEQRINALKATGLPSAFTQADTLQKALIEREKDRIVRDLSSSQRSQSTLKKFKSQWAPGTGSGSGMMIGPPLPEPVCSFFASRITPLVHSWWTEFTHSSEGQVVGAKFRW